ncbi:universal stress protein [Streptomyces sp. NPDC019396]|uniref:universal stress protein n=1 Tax=Streptomyces sp. NPDC019396 TaxID=3154687 RepID=UPI0033F831DF
MGTVESPLVVGVDGSDSSLDALVWAVDEAARHSLALRLVYASRWERYEGPAAFVEDLERPSEQQLIDAVVDVATECAHRRNAGVKVVAEVLPEDTVTALVTESRRASMLVTGTRGRGGLTGLLLGSVSLGVAARAHCPVVVVRGDTAGRKGTHGRVLLGIADTGQGSSAAGFAFREAAVRACELEAVRAWRRPAHQPADHILQAADPGLYNRERAAAQIDVAVSEEAQEHPEVLLRRSTVEGPAHKVLVQHSAAADLVVVGAHRRQGHFGLQLGRVTHTVLHHSECPVAVVPQEE